MQNLVKQSLKKSFYRREVKNMIKATLYYPEYANTFALTYAIACAKDNKIADIPWTSELYDWGKERKKEMGKNNPPKNEIIAFYGTDKEVEYNSLQGKKDQIKLPVYHPRLIFMPYDYTIYESIYKDSKINPRGIVTSEDLKYIPSLDDFTELFLERGISKKLQSDTKLQAEIIKRILFNGKSYTNNKYPIQLYYYGAPLTLFYLNKYPEFLPIRIDIALNNILSDLPNDNSDKKEYFDLFNTYLFLRIGENVDDNIINKIKDKVKESFFQVYSDALHDPQLLSNVYKKYKEDVPRGLFYTMKNVEDFAKAITLHCDAEIEKIREEIELDETKGKALEQKSKDTLRFFKEFTSESDRSSEGERTKDLQDIKELALGCRAFLFFSFCRKKEKGKKDWNQVFELENRKNVKLKGTYLHLYKSVLTFLAWRYCLRYYYLEKKKTVPKMQYAYSTLTRPILVQNYRKHIISDLDICWISENDYIQYKSTEEKVIVALSERVQDGISDDKMIEAKKCVSYVEYILGSFVEDSFKNRDNDCLRTAYRKFNKIISERYDYDKMTRALFEKFLPFKVYEY